MIGVAGFEEASLLGWGEFRTSATTPREPPTLWPADPRRPWSRALSW
jgi:hypothetical protein